LNNSISNQNEIDHFIQVDLDSVVEESLHRNKQSGIPKKQGRMFQLNLGQGVSILLNFIFIIDYFNFIEWSI